MIHLSIDIPDWLLCIFIAIITIDVVISLALLYVKYILYKQKEKLNNYKGI